MAALKLALPIKGAVVIFGMFAADIHFGTYAKLFPGVKLLHRIIAVNAITFDKAVNIIMEGVTLRLHHVHETNDKIQVKIAEIST